jgi:hypothetical protein
MDQHQLAQDESTVGKGTTLDDDSRHQLALKMIQKARLPQAMPEGFNPLLASSADLRRYGIPPRPNKDSHPLYHAKWVDLLSRPLGVVVPTLTTEGKTMRPPRRPDPTRKTIHPNASGWPWSGAVLTHPPSEFIDSVSASWTVPNVFPPASAWNNAANNWNDGEWYSSIYKSSHFLGKAVVSKVILIRAEAGFWLLQRSRKPALRTKTNLF